jgi:AraC-like DNA-binding protein
MRETAFRAEHGPRAQRCGWWHELAAARALASHLARTGATDVPPGVRVVPLGQVMVVSMPVPVLRPPERPGLVLGRERDRYQVVISPTRAIPSPGEDPLAAENAGRLLLLEGGQPHRRVGRPALRLARCVVAQFPKALLGCGPNAVREMLGRPVACASGLGALLHGFLGQIGRDGGLARSADRPRLGSIILDLTVSLIEAEAGLGPNGSGRDAPLLDRIKAFIAANLHDPALTPAEIAGAHHISVRHLHRLFRQDGRGVSSHLRHSRLERCRRDLEDPRLAHTPVHAIGARWGFPRPPDFSRSFRGAYGLPPGEYRRRSGRAATYRL